MGVSKTTVQKKKNLRGGVSKNKNVAEEECEKKRR